MNTIIQLVLSILTGISVCIPLVIKLVQYIKTSIKEKNWTALLSMITQYMEQAEQIIDDGKLRKEWVLGMIKSSSQTINYDIDYIVVSKIIDNICATSKIVNAGNSNE